jgi:hypothetical protein
MSPLDLQDEMQEACQFYRSAQIRAKTDAWGIIPMLCSNFPQGENSKKTGNQQFSA